RTSASVRSCTRPASGPKMSTIGRFGRARKFSISEVFSATMRSLDLLHQVETAAARRALPLQIGVSSAASARMRSLGARLRPSDEIGCKPGPDIVGDDFRRAQLSILQSAHACEPLLLAWNVIGHAGEGLAGHDDLASYDFGQGVSGIDAVILHIRARGVPVDDDRCTRGGYGNL